MNRRVSKKLKKIAISLDKPKGFTVELVYKRLKKAYNKGKIKLS